MMLGIFVFVLVPNRSQHVRLMPSIKTTEMLRSQLSLPEDKRSGNIFSLLNPFNFNQSKVVVEIKEGETFFSALRLGGVNGNEINDIIVSLEGVFDVSKIRAGTNIIIKPEESSRDEEGNLSVVVSRLEIIKSPINSIIVEKTPLGFKAKEDIRNGISEIVRKNLVVEAGSSLFGEAEKLGVPESILSQIDYIYSFDVSFAHEVYPGDSLNLMYEKVYSQKGAPVNGAEKLLFADLDLHGNHKKIYRYEHENGKIEFYNEEGKSAQKTLKRAPIGGRVSSGFGLRRHPVLGFSRKHNGIDYPAPTGTPIKAGGDGVVVFRGWKSGYGNYVRIRHNGSYDTGYAHASAFASGVHVGDYVKQGQVIAYVGNTGISTGAHLHYEMFKGRAFVNPLTAPLPAGKNLGGEDLIKFFASKVGIDEQFNSLGANKVRYASDFFGVN
jgi:murein DD-endopeptidase MepM/ murein hydrolase activator NlpD